MAASTRAIAWVSLAVATACTLAVAGCTNDRTSGAPVTAPAPSTVSPSGVSPSGVSPSGMVQGSVQASTSAPAATPALSSTASSTTQRVVVRAPVTVVEIGDSLGQDLGFGMHDLLSGNAYVTVVQAAKGDSGLVQPQFYDWPRHLDELLTRYDPAIVVVFLGANDVQDFYDNGVLRNFGTAGWKTAYSARVSALMDEATAAGAQMLWVGMPVMRNPAFSDAMQVLNGVYQDQAETHPGVTYFSSWDLFSGSAGQYVAKTTAADGSSVDLRAPDGVHIAFGRRGDGAWLLASAVADEMRDLYGLPGVPAA